MAWRKRDRPEIEKLSGQRHVPLLVIEKDAICDSLRIIEHLDWRQSAQLVSSASALSLDAAEDGIEGEEHGAARRRRARRGSPGARPASPSAQPLSTAP